MSAYSTRLDEAVALAVDSFRDVVRKGSGVPYITHLFAVMVTVGEYGGDEDQMIAAVLHDWLEDIDGSDPEYLRARFGDRVMQMVLALSDTTVRPKPPWRERKERYLAHLAMEPAEVKLISAADKLHNCRTTRRDVRRGGVSTFSRFNGGRDGTLWYFRQVVDRLGVGWTHPVLDELREEVEGLWRDAGEA